MLMMSLGKGQLKLPGLGSLLDWRKAAPADALKKEPKPIKAAVKLESPAAVPTPPPPSAAKTVDATALPPLDPSMIAHVFAVQSALEPEEAILARQVAADLDPAELRAWFDELSWLSVPDAVARIRSLIGIIAKSGSAS